MPMDFPDMKSLEQHADMLKFRKPNPNESEGDYRKSLADFVAPMDFIESEEIRNGKGWDKFSEVENFLMIARQIGRRQK